VARRGCRLEASPLLPLGNFLLATIRADPTAPSRDPFVKLGSESPVMEFHFCPSFVDDECLEPVLSLVHHFDALPYLLHTNDQRRKAPAVRFKTVQPIPRQRSIIQPTFKGPPT